MHRGSFLLFWGNSFPIFSQKYYNRGIPVFISAFSITFYNQSTSVKSTENFGETQQYFSKKEASHLGTLSADKPLR
jgi:hypothetical protein